MSAEKKSKYARLSDTAVARLEPYRDLMGKRPDGEIAKLAGMDRRYVVVFRTHNDIPAYRRGSAASDAKSAEADEPKRFRRSRLDEFRHLMGEVSDGRIAELASCSREAVMRYRKRYGILAAGRGRSSTVDPVMPPPMEIEAAPAEPALVEAVQEAPVELAPLPDASDELPPEADDVIAQQEIGTPVPAEDPGPGLDGFVVTVRQEGQDERWMVLGPDLVQAAHAAMAQVAQLLPEAKIIELRYCAPLL